MDLTRIMHAVLCMCVIGALAGHAHTMTAYAESSTSLAISIKNGDLTFDFLPDNASDTAHTRTAYALIKCNISDRKIWCPTLGQLQLNNAKPGAITLAFAPKYSDQSVWENEYGDKIPYDQGTLRLRIDNSIHAEAGQAINTSFTVVRNPPPFGKDAESITVFNSMAGFSRYAIEGLSFEHQLVKKAKRGSYTIEFIATLI